MSTQETSQQIYDVLIQDTSKVSLKYMSIFKLKERNEKDLLIKCFNYLDNSELLKHEVTYALG